MTRNVSCEALVRLGGDRGAASAELLVESARHVHVLTRWEIPSIEITRVACVNREGLRATAGIESGNVTGIVVGDCSLLKGDYLGIAIHLAGDNLTPHHVLPFRVLPYSGYMWDRSSKADRAHIPLEMWSPLLRSLLVSTASRSSQHEKPLTSHFCNITPFDAFKTT